MRSQLESKLPRALPHRPVGGLGNRASRPGAFTNHAGKARHHQQQQLEQQYRSRTNFVDAVPEKDKIGSSLAALVLEQGPALRATRSVSGVCCGTPCAGGAPNAWYFRGSRWQRGSSVPTFDNSSRSGSPSLARDTTMLISSSPRPRDDSASNLDMLKGSVASVRRELGVGTAHGVLIFDGLGDHAKAQTRDEPRAACACAFCASAPCGVAACML